MRSEPGCDLSVIIPFGDDEDRVGAMSRRAAAHLTALDVRFEILAVDEGSSDNSVALLRLLRDSVPGLRLLEGLPRGGFAAGAREARGRAVLLWDPAHAASPLGALGWARARIADGSDVALVPRRFVVCRRTASWRALERARGRGNAYQDRLVSLARRSGLRVDSPAAAAAPVPVLRRLLFFRA